MADAESKRPSKRGLIRYPADGCYSDTGNPCTCLEKCPIDCKGECGCAACRDSWNDFLSEE